MKDILIILSLICIIFSCRKDKPKIINPEIIPSYDSVIGFIPSCIGGNYDDYSTYDFDKVKKKLKSMNSICSMGYYEYDYGNYSYGFPIFNPVNPYEILFYKRNLIDSPDVVELYKFSFCTGRTRLITNKAFYNLDWSSKGWISFTSFDYLMYKIKDNGDSLTALPSVGNINSAGKWNPSGTLNWIKGNIIDENGTIVYSLNEEITEPKAWMNDSVLLGLSTGYTFHSLNIKTGEKLILNSNWTCGSCNVVYNPDKNECYVNGGGAGLIRYSLDGSNEKETISGYYDSYYFVAEDYANDQITGTLIRGHWKDSANCEIYYRSHLMLMDTDGNNERLIELPE